MKNSHFNSFSDFPPYELAREEEEEEELNLKAKGQLRNGKITFDVVSDDSSFLLSCVIIIFMISFLSWANAFNGLDYKAELGS